MALHAQLLVCGADGACSVVADTTVGAELGLVPAAVTMDFGAVDATIPEGGSIRLVVDVPPASAADVVLFAGTRATPSAVTLTFA